MDIRILKTFSVKIALKECGAGSFAQCFGVPMGIILYFTIGLGYSGRQLLFSKALASWQLRFI